VKQCVYETEIGDVPNLRKRLIWFEFEQNTIEAAIDWYRDRQK